MKLAPLKITFLGIRITIGWDKIFPWLSGLITTLPWAQYRAQIVSKYGDVGGLVIDEAEAWVNSQLGIQS